MCDVGDLRDKVALITGGASGLGRAAAFALAEAGATIVVVDRDEQDGPEVAEKVGGHFFAADVSSMEANEAMVDFAVARCGGLDLVYLNAGIALNFGLGEDFDLERYRAAMGVNVDAVVFGTHAALPALKQRGGGAIVATASLAGLTALPVDPVYTATKHAVVGIARSMGPALAPDNIRFNAVCPGFAETKILEPIRGLVNEMGVPIMAAEEVAAVVQHLFEGDMTGECHFVQPGRTGAFRFSNIPGPRVEPASR